MPNLIVLCSGSRNARLAAARSAVDSVIGILLINQGGCPVRYVFSQAGERPSQHIVDLERGTRVRSEELSGEFVDLVSSKVSRMKCLPNKYGRQSANACELILITGPVYAREETWTCTLRMPADAAWCLHPCMNDNNAFIY